MGLIIPALLLSYGLTYPVRYSTSKCPVNRKGIDVGPFSERQCSLMASGKLAVGVVVIASKKGLSVHG